MRSPGATAEAIGTNSEIELAVNLGDPTDQFVLGGTAGADLLSAGTRASRSRPIRTSTSRSCRSGAIELAGGAGNDTLTSGGGYGTAQAFLGRAILRGEGDDDALGGCAFDDVIVGGPGADTLQGNSRNDELLGEGGADTLNGRDGNDRLVGGPGVDSLSGGYGDDTLGRPTARPTR